MQNIKQKINKLKKHLDELCKQEKQLKDQTEKDLDRAKRIMIPKTYEQYYIVAKTELKNKLAEIEAHKESILKQIDELKQQLQAERHL